ncbi:MAG: hypothetical protein R3C53_07870 [Pirellulaceae bacterium]
MTASDRAYLSKMPIVLLLLTLTWCSGCKPSQPDETAATAPRPVASDVPLRIVIAAPVADIESIRRQWLSDSEQPLAIDSISVDQLIGGAELQADVVLYPSYLLGELQSRGWIVKLPEMTADLPSVQEGDSQPAVVTIPKSWQSGAQYNETVLGLPLGCSLAIPICSDSLKSELTNSLSWETLLAAIEQGQAVEATTSSDQAANAPEFVADPIATVDRFLAIAFSLTERNVRYGLLFDIESMQPRLLEPEFLRAAEIMGALSRQTNGLTSVVGSHSHAWRWAAQHESKVVAIASPIMLDAEARSVEVGGVLSLEPYAFHNSGSALLASLSATCRQTRQSVAFLSWLRRSSTRDFLAPLVPGIEASQLGGVESLSYRARQSLVHVVASDTSSQEPRLPGSHEYRRVLGEQLINFLRGNQTAEAALSSTAQRWQEITAKLANQSDAEPKDVYQRSLSLTQ